MKKEIIILKTILAVIIINTLTSCEANDINDEQISTEIYGTDKGTINGPGSNEDEDEQ